MAKTHDHLVQVDDAANCIRVFRVMPDGAHVLFAEYALPADQHGWTDSVAALARALGEDLLMDAPIPRQRYSL
ncbi:hypothetical protein [Frateuria sp. YIM B11624]|uniref:hypothetical protein n=1 Tax=Frateuria sp. YIM B11624 TaxID=3143185 RepID=UPI003C70760D